MGAVFQLPARNGFSEQERSRIAAVVASAGAAVAWYRTECGALWGCLKNADATLGAITREKGMVLWFPRDALSPLHAHISLDECLTKVTQILV